MKIISTKTHAVIDYLLGFIMLCVPTMMDFPDDSLVCRTLVIPGLILLLTSMLSEHEINLAHFFPYQIHLKIDLAIGAFLCLSPMIIGLSQSVSHLFFGSVILANSLLSKKSKNIENSTFNEIQN